MEDQESITELPTRKSHKLYQPFLAARIQDREHSETNVSYLYPEILALIFSCLDVTGKGRAAQVCKAWRDAAYHKSVWRGVEAKLHANNDILISYPSLIRRGIKRIQVLTVDNNLGKIIKEIPGLEHLSLRGCNKLKDETLIDAFIGKDDFNLQNLIIFNLSLCKQITDVGIGNTIAFMKNLQVLELGGCEYVTDSSLVCVAICLRNLKSLNLRCTKIGDAGLEYISGTRKEEHLKGCPNLEYLNLEDCMISDSGLKFISLGLNNLKNLNLSFCENIGDRGLKYLAKMISLKELNLASNENITDIGIGYLAGESSTLTKLDLSFCSFITDQSLTHMSQGLFTLKSLSLNNCYITETGLLKLAHTLDELETLNLGQCQISDFGLLHTVESLKNLKQIDLYGCNVSPTTCRLMKKLPHLKFVNFDLCCSRL